MSALHAIRRLARRFGVDVSHYPAADAGFRAFRAFTSGDPDVILDVGGNDGGFALNARRFGYRGDIVSFEPGRQALERLHLAAVGDPRWQVQGVALGSENAEMTLNIAANEGASSSFLPMLAAHRRAAPGAVYVGQETVAVRRLDDWCAAHGRRWVRPALKVDTQGFERHVLAGAERILAEIVAIQLELSLTGLYEGAWNWTEAVDWLSSRGFEMAGVVPGFSDPMTGRLLQFDGVFITTR